MKRSEIVMLLLFGGVIFAVFHRIIYPTPSSLLGSQPRTHSSSTAMPSAADGPDTSFLIPKAQALGRGTAEFKLSSNAAASPRKGTSSNRQTSGTTDPIRQQRANTKNRSPEAGQTFAEEDSIPVRNERRTQDVRLPIASLGSGEADLALTPKQQEAVSKIQSDFAATTSDDALDPSSNEVVRLPIAFLGSGEADLALTPKQQEAVSKIQSDFAATTSADALDPSSNDYLKRWVTAQQLADAQLRLSLGWQGYLQYSLAQARQEYAESGHTRINPRIDPAK